MRPSEPARTGLGSVAIERCGVYLEDNPVVAKTSRCFELALPALHSDCIAGNLLAGDFVERLGHQTVVDDIH